MSWYIAFMAIELYPGTRVISLAEIFAVHCTTVGLPFWLSWWRIRWQWGRPGFDPCVGNIPWRRERLPTPVFWPGEFHGLYSPWGRKESEMTERLSLSHSLTLLLVGWSAPRFYNQWCCFTSPWHHGLCPSVSIMFVNIFIDSVRSPGYEGYHLFPHLADSRLELLNVRTLILLHGHCPKLPW